MLGILSWTELCPSLLVIDDFFVPCWLPLQEDLQQLQADFDDLTEDRRQLLDQLETLQLQVNVGRNQVLEAQQLAARSTAETSLARWDNIEGHQYV